MTLVLDPKKIRRNLLHTFLYEGVHTKEDLDFYIKEYLGFDVPKKKNCPNHVSPFRFLHDIFFERTSSAFAYGSRGSGKTRIFSLLNHLDLVFRPGVTIVSAGATLDQSHRCYDYFCGYYKDPLLSSLLVENLMSYSEATNGSTLEVITGSVKGFNGPHPVKVRIDELELIKWSTLQEGLSMALSADGYRAQTVMASTRKWAGGSVTRLLKEASQRRIKVFNFCCLEVMQTCQRECFGDKNHGDCPAYHYMNREGEYVPLCKGAAHNSRGWMPVEDFIEKISLIDRDVILAQWFNRKTSDSTLVYGDYFNPEVHILSWDQFKYLTGHERPPAAWKRYAAVDFGAHFGYLKCTVSPEGVWFVYFEYFHDATTEGSRLLKDHAVQIKNSPDFGRESGVFYDPSGLQEAIELEALGISLTMADNNVLLGIDDVKKLMERDPKTGRPKLYILEDCEELLDEIGEGYVHPMSDDGLPDKDAVVKDNDHLADCLRYLVRSPKSAFASYTTRRAQGLW